ncbi:NAD(P)/FAD-dependent oxidoreductase [Chloroflexota bacterium]
MRNISKVGVPVLNMKYSSDVLVIGGGEIGICAAYYLSEMGRRVVVVEQGEIASGCSYGNAGLIVPSHSIPLAAPGVIAEGVRWLFNPKSPFYVKPRLDFGLLSWLWSFYRNCNHSKMLESLNVLKEIGFASLAQFDSMIKNKGLECGYQQAGWLLIYKTQEGFSHGIVEAALLRDHGIKVNTLSRDETLALEPSVRSDVVGSINYLCEAHLDPAKFVLELTKRLDSGKVEIHTETQVTGFEVDVDKLTGVVTTKGDFNPKVVVMAGGALVPGLAARLGIKVEVQPARGYSVSLKEMENIPRRPLYLCEEKVAVTPLEGEVRLAGVLEMAGMDLSISGQRVEGILEAAGNYLKLSGNELKSEP